MIAGCRKNFRFAHSRVLSVHLSYKRVFALITDTKQTRENWDKHDRFELEIIRTVAGQHEAERLGEVNIVASTRRANLATEKRWVTAPIFVAYGSASQLLY